MKLICFAIVICFLVDIDQGCGNGSRKWWKRLNYCGSRSGSTLKKEAGSGTFSLFTWSKQSGFLESRLFSSQSELLENLSDCSDW